MKQHNDYSIENDTLFCTVDMIFRADNPDYDDPVLNGLTGNTTKDITINTTIDLSSVWGVREFIDDNADYTDPSRAVLMFNSGNQFGVNVPFIIMSNYLRNRNK